MSPTVPLSKETPCVFACPAQAGCGRDHGQPEDGGRGPVELPGAMGPPHEQGRRRR